MRTIACALVVAVVLAISGTAWAAQPVDEARPASAGGFVGVYASTGAVRVVGWNRGEVRVTGRLGEEADRLDFASDGRQAEIRVIPGRSGNPSRAELEIHIPEGSRVEISGGMLDVDASSVTGLLNVAVDSGRVRISGQPQEAGVRSRGGRVEVSTSGTRVQVETSLAMIALQAESGEVLASTVNGKISLDGEHLVGALRSVSGNIEVSTKASRIQVQTGSGCVSLHGEGGEADVSTMSGSIVARGSRFKRGRFESYAGDIRFEGNGARDGRFDFRAHGGTVDLQLPGGGNEVFVTTESGKITVTGEGFKRGWFESQHGDVRFEGSLNVRGALDVRTEGGVELMLPAEVDANFRISTEVGDIQSELGPVPEIAAQGEVLNFSTGTGRSWVSVKARRDVSLRKRPTRASPDTTSRIQGKGR